MKKLFVLLPFVFIFAMTLIWVQHKNVTIVFPKGKTQEEVRKVTANQNTSLVRYHEDITYDVEMAAEERESITFIMGEDKSSDNPYYAEAEKYYRMNPTTFYEQLVTTCRSLQEVLDYLETHPTDNGEPYGTVNVVVHSNEWKGVGMSIVPNGDRINTSNLRNAIDEGIIHSLSDEVVDFETEIMIYGCGLGNNEELLDLFAEAFGGNDIERPVVRSSKLFIQYASTTDESRRYLAENWYGFFKTGYRPSDSELAQQLEVRYEEEEVEWLEALSRTEPRFAGDSYHYYFNVPVNWMVTYGSEIEMPKINTAQEQEAWLNNQTELKEALAATNIPMDKFRWTFKKTSHTFEDGTTEPGIYVSGKSSILCVLRAMTIENYDHPERPLPFEPELTDERFYTSSNGGMENSVLSLK